MSKAGTRRSRALLRVGTILLALVWGYVAVGPSGILPRRTGPGLLMPGQRTNARGAAIAEVDQAAWDASCTAAGLPPFPDPTGIELEPVRRLVEASRRWSASGDGDELGRMGEIALALDLHETALDLFAAARELGPDVERWTYLYGVECQQLGRTREALAALEEARDTNDSYGTTHARIGALYLELGELERADASYARTAELDPAPEVGLVGRARVALERRDFEAALVHLDLAITSTPRDYLAHRLRSQALAGLERLDEAAAAADVSNRLPAYRGWLSFDPRIAEAHRAASTQRSLENALNAALGSGNLQAALAAGEALLERQPRSAAVMSTLARILANTNSLERALALAGAAVQLDPGSLRMLATQADIAIKASDLATAAEAAEAMVRIDFENADAHQALGRVRFLEGRGEDAVGELRHAVELEPGEVRHRAMLVDVLLRLKRNAQAETVLLEILELDPRNAQARSQLEALRSGR